MKRRGRQPDFDRLRRALLRQGAPGPVPPIEFLADVQLMEQVVGEKFPIESLADLKSCGEAECKRACDLIVRFQEQLGYDYVSVLVEVPLDSTYTGAADTGGGGTRYWQDQSHGPIGSWVDFDAYRWPKPEDISYRALDYTASHLPEGMKVIAVCDGVFEWAKAMMGLETFSFALMDEADLVAAVCERVGELTAAACQNTVNTRTSARSSERRHGLLYRHPDFAKASAPVRLPVGKAACRNRPRKRASVSPACLWQRVCCDG